MARDLGQVEAVCRRVAESLGLELIEVELTGSGKHRTLRITIDRPDSTARPGEPGGVMLEDCENVSREAGTILDVEDAVPGGEYLLEVSSPGLDRKLLKARDYERFTGSRVKLQTRQPILNNRHFEGKLTKFQNDVLTLDLSVARKRKKGFEGQDVIEIPLANVEKAKLVPEF